MGRQHTHSAGILQMPGCSACVTDGPDEAGFVEVLIADLAAARERGDVKAAANARTELTRILGADVPEPAA